MEFAELIITTALLVILVVFNFRRIRTVWVWAALYTELRIVENPPWHPDHDSYFASISSKML
jgi:hypothetical protein